MLSRSRSITEAGLGAISYSEVYYFLKLGLSILPFDVDTFIDIMFYIDAKFMKYHADESKKELDRIKHKK